MPATVQIGPGKVLKGTIEPPGDKSISHRALMLGALASGKSSVHNFLKAADCLSTLAAMRSLGVQVEEKSPSRLEIYGVGLRGLKSPSRELNLGNSGTTMRLLLGILAGQPFSAVVTGDASLSSRPMRRVTDPLRKMGAKINGREDANFAPLTIQGGSLKAIRYENRLGSAQVKSCLLLAGLFAEGTTEVVEIQESRDHTERLMHAMQVDIVQEGSRILIKGAGKMKPFDLEVPGDLSSAAFWLAAGAIQRGAITQVKKVGLNPTRMGFIKALKKMGANVKVTTNKNGVEPIGSIEVTGSDLQGCTIAKGEIPSLIDELPLIMVLGAVAQGKTVIRGAAELRVKETDRIHAMARNLEALGVSVVEYPDGIEVIGQEEFHGGKVTSFGDHRIAMSMAIAGLRSRQEVIIEGADCVDISYPEFFREFERLRGKS